MKAVKLALLCLLCSITCATADEIDGFRCGNSLVYDGLNSAEVLGKCGEPVSREVLSEPIRAHLPSGASHIVGTTTIERWIYDREPGQFPALLTFEEGQLKKIELLSSR